MAYNITARLYQSNTNNFFSLVEKTVFSGGYWTESQDKHTLRMGGSGTSGSLRFLSDDKKENFVITLGVHNYARWGDIVPNTEDTALIVNRQYYEKEWNGSGVQQRVDTRWKTPGSQEIVSNGRKYAFNYRVATGNDLAVDVVVS